MRTGIQVFVVSELSFQADRVFVIDFRGEQAYCAIMAAGMVKWIPCKMEQAQSIDDPKGPKPLFILPGGIAGEVWPQLIERVTSKGFELPSVAHVRGELAATKLHLEDMRKLALAPENMPTSVWACACKVVHHFPVFKCQVCGDHKP